MVYHKILKYRLQAEFNEYKNEDIENEIVVLEKMKSSLLNLRMSTNI